MARAPLEERLVDPGFSPGRRDFPGLFALLVGDNEGLSKRAEAILAKTGEAGAEALVTIACATAVDPARAHRVARVLGGLGGTRAREHLATRLVEGTGKERRWAGTSLAKVWPEGAEPLLLDALSKATHPEDIRAFVQALGKVGGPRSLDALESLSLHSRASDPETDRVLGKAKLLLARTFSRGELVLVDTTSPLPRVAVRFTCRDGLESVLAEELAEITSVSATSRGSVVVMHEGPLHPLLRVRTALSFAFEIDAPRRPEIPLPARVAELLVSNDVLTIVRVLEPTHGPNAPPTRFRLELPEGAGRAAIFDVARRVAESGAPLVNDPTEATWTVTAVVRDERLSLMLEPRKVQGARFDYRERDVPAASHPTIAAALARLSGPQATDVVWDPFCGSGTELIERAKLGPFAALHGTDLREDALAAARANLLRAQVSATLEQGDAALVAIPEGLTHVITNPPLGRRLRGEHEELLTKLVTRVGAALPANGRLVWVSPTRRLDVVAEGVGLALARAFDVDLGGFSGRIEVRRKVAQAPTGTPRPSRS